MEEELKERVARLHRESFIVDAHFDLTFDVANQRDRGKKNVVETAFMPGFRAGGFDLIVSAIFIDDIFLPEMGLRKALDQISHLHEEMDASPGNIRIVKNAAEAKAASESGEVGVILSLEGADPIQNDIGLLRIFFELGVRGLGLTWSRRNYLGDGSRFIEAPCGKKGGLTEFGIQVIEKAESLGMFIDVSHLNDVGFRDAIEASKKPMIASHANCRSLSNTVRNLTDDQIKALAKKGGVVGMAAISAFVREDADNQKIGAADLADHLEHVVKLTDIHHVGIGFDFCEGFRDYYSMGSPLNTYDVIDGHQNAAEFTAELVKRGYSDADIGLVLGGNFMRVFEETLG